MSNQQCNNWEQLPTSRGQKQVYCRKSTLPFGTLMYTLWNQTAWSTSETPPLTGWVARICLKARDPGLIPEWERSPGERDRLPTPVFVAFSGGSDGKESACGAGDLDSIPGLRRFPWRRTWQLTPVFLPGESLWTEVPGGLQSMGLQRVKHNGTTKHSWVVPCGSFMGLLSLPSCVPVTELFWGLDGLMQVTCSPQGMACSKPFIIFSIICSGLLQFSH